LRRGVGRVRVKPFVGPIIYRNQVPRVNEKIRSTRQNFITFKGRPVSDDRGRESFAHSSTDTPVLLVRVNRSGRGSDSAFRVISDSHNCFKKRRHQPQPVPDQALDNFNGPATRSLNPRCTEISLSPSDVEAQATIRQSSVIEFVSMRKSSASRGDSRSRRFVGQRQLENRGSNDQTRGGKWNEVTCQSAFPSTLRWAFHCNSTWTFSPTFPRFGSTRGVDFLPCCTLQKNPRWTGGQFPRDVQGPGCGNLMSSPPPLDGPFIHFCSRAMSPLDTA